jgi:hypothetical protein
MLTYLLLVDTFCLVWSQSKQLPRKNIASAAINSIKAEPLKGDYGDGIKYSASAAGLSSKKLQLKSASDATRADAKEAGQHAKDSRKEAPHEPIGVVRKGKTVIPIRSLDELGRWLVDSNRRSGDYDRSC